MLVFASCTPVHIRLCTIGCIIQHPHFYFFTIHITILHFLFHIIINIYLIFMLYNNLFKIQHSTIILIKINIFNLKNLIMNLI